MSVKPVVSVDLWGTLIKSSPLFTQEMVDMTKKYFPERSSEEILNAFSVTKTFFNQMVESTGFQPKNQDLYYFLFSLLNGGYEQHLFYANFYQEYQQLALQFKPEVYSSETIEYLQKLSEIATLQLSSNTMFISGKTLHSTLVHHKMDQFFTKFYFSDQIKCSKPCRFMYGHSDYHIGDKTITDGTGAKQAGSTPIIINSNILTLKDAYDFIAQVR